MPEVNENLVIPTHDAILPYMFEGVKWAIPNVGDNKETHNMAIARLFEKIGEHLQAFSVRTDCLSPVLLHCLLSSIITTCLSVCAT